MTDSKHDNAEKRRQDAEEYELESEESGDLDSAMQEALRAVERSAARNGKADESAAENGAVEDKSAADETLSAATSELASQVAELRDRHVRTLADFENYRKRIERERVEARRYAGFEILADLLPILDNLQLAIDSPGSVEDLKTGVDLILRQFQELLRSQGAERIEAVGRPFDPTLHDAVSREEDAAVEQPTVGEELRAGYRVGERLLRPASVRVRVPAGREAESEEEEGSSRSQESS